MEKFSQYRDRGSGIAPFFPNPTQVSGIYLPFRISLFLIRLPILLTIALGYFLVLQWLPIGSLGKKASLWLILGVPGVWWIDLQIDGVRRGDLARHNQARLPQPSSIIASSLTSPIDALYLAAIFDPIFTASYPSTRLVHRISLFQALCRAFQHPQSTPPKNAKLVKLQTLLQQHPKRVAVIFPECTTTNGRGILTFSPSLLTAPATTKIFPISLRYTPGDITTPVPSAYFTFFWNLLSKPTHCIRVRIAESVHNASLPSLQKTQNPRNVLETVGHDGSNSSDTLSGSGEGESLSFGEKKVLDQIAEALARLGRVKRVGLGVKDKEGFLKAWAHQKKN